MFNYKKIVLFVLAIWAIDVLDNHCEYEDTDDSENYFVSMVGDGKMDDWVQAVTVNNKLITMKIDCGAQCNVMSLATYEDVKSPNDKLERSKARLSSFVGDTTLPVGQVRLPCYINKTRYKLLFQVVKDSMPAPLLGKVACVKAKLIVRVKVSEVKQENEDILSEYPDLFNGLGCLSGECHITVDKTVQPVVHAPRRVPYALRGRVEEQLKKMEQQKIIAKVPENHPTDWVNSMITVQKPDGSLRICLDPRDLNKAIKREQYPLPTLEEITARIETAKFFSTIDAKSAYHQLKLDDESTDLFTFNTHLGRFKYLRLPMGISTAGDRYQRRIKDEFADINGVEIMMDDILVFGDTEQQHDERLKAVLDRARAIGLKLNRKKCIVKHTEVKYLGFIFSAGGLRIDSSRISAIQDMPNPENKEDVRRFLGMINFVGRFIENLSDITAPLRELLKKENEFHWSKPQMESYRHLKECLCKAPVLAYYDGSKELILQVDASSHGVGASLIQEGRPVAFASKALTSTQQAYAQIEKEAYAILFGCERFSDYIIGREVVVQSDHKPLETIVKKPLHKAPPRLQRMLIQLQRYPGIRVVYTRGKDLYLADTLSRPHPHQVHNKEDMREKAIAVHTIAAIPMSSAILETVEKATEMDNSLVELTRFVLNGWPASKAQTSEICKPYWHYREEISMINGILFKNHKVIIPKSMQRDMLEKLHRSHLGIVKTKQRARDIMYWPGMNQQIENIIGECSSCLKYQRANTKEPMKSHTIPEIPWYKIGVDLFEYAGEHYIVAVDYLSKFPLVQRLKDQTSRQVIEVMKGWFGVHGVPSEIVSDNGPCFNSSEYNDFACTWNFKPL